MYFLWEIFQVRFGRRVFRRDNIFIYLRLWFHHAAFTQLFTLRVEPSHYLMAFSKVTKPRVSLKNIFMPIFNMLRIKMAIIQFYAENWNKILKVGI